MLGDIDERCTTAELMDDPQVDLATLEEVLKDINRSNTMLNGNGITIKAVAHLIQANPKETYTIVDMGCGDGSMLRAIALFFRKNTIKGVFIGIDLSETGIQIAKKSSKEYPEIQYLQQDILTLNANTFACDILLCTLTMHHFPQKEIPIFLDKFSKLAKLGVVINDLHRNKIAYWLFKLFSIFFIRTKIAKHDGAISIRSGFLKEDLKVFSEKITNAKHNIQWKWAFRYVWVMQMDRLTAADE